MKVLVLGRTRRRDIEAGIHRALLRAGHRATLVEERRTRRLLGARLTGAWLHARVAAFRPHRMIMSKPVGMPVPALEKACARVPTTMWYRDVRIPPEPGILARARLAEVVFLTAGGQTAEFEAAGVKRALFLPDGADPDLDRPAEPSPDFACDVAFLGSGGDDYRASFLRRVGREFRLRTWGEGWEGLGAEVGWMGGPAYYRDFARVCASAAIVLGIERGFHREAAVSGTVSNRMWRVVAAGGFYLGFAAPGVRDLLRDGEHCAFYDDEDHAMAQIERWLRDREGRERIREAGRAFVMAHHTLGHRVESLLTGAPFRNPLTEAAR